MQSTPSNYLNITLHPDGNVDQSEMAIKAAPTNSFNVLAGDNAVVQSVSPVYYNQAYYYSTNEGRSYDGSDTLPTNSTVLSDPVVAYDLNGNAFFSFMKSTDGGSSYSIVVKKSTDDGASWANDVTVAGPGNLDKDHMAIDVSSGSSYKNFIYVAWTDFSQSPSPIELSRSTDGGSTFSNPVTVSGTSGYNFAHGVCLAVGPSGELYATWVYYDQWPGYESGIGFNKSTDGG